MIERIDYSPPLSIREVNACRYRTEEINEYCTEAKNKFIHDNNSNVKNKKAIMTVWEALMQ